MKNIAVAILNYNGEGYLNRFLAQVIDHSIDAEVVVIDNASTDGSVNFIRENFPEVKIIQLDKNYGYTGGYNKGIKGISQEFIVLLNSDVSVTEQWLNPLISMMNSSPKIAMVQPKIMNMTNPEKFDYAGASGGFIDHLGYPFCRGRVFDLVENDHHQYDDSMEVFWASGAAVMVRKQLFLDIGGFDIEFFAHMEEIDLAWRLKRAGFQIFVQPQSVIYHLGGGTLNALSPTKTRLNFKNSLITLYKNEDSRYLWLKILSRLFLDGIAGLRLMIQGKFKHAIAIIKAHFQFYHRVFTDTGLRNRTKKAIDQVRIGKPNFNGIYSGSIVFQSFIKRKNKFSDLGKFE